MTTQYTSGRGSSGGFLAFLLALILGAVALALFIRHAASGPMLRIANLIAGRPATIDSSVPAVVEKIQRLSRLETVVYSLDTVVEGNKSSPVLPDVLGGDKLLLVVHGQSVAGIDLAQLKPEDVKVDSENGSQGIHVTLPASQLFITTLDNDHTRVYSRTTGLLVPADQNLESDTRVKAQQQLQQAALTDGILDDARKKRSRHGHRSSLLARLPAGRRELTLTDAPFASLLPVAGWQYLSIYREVQVHLRHGLVEPFQEFVDLQEQVALFAYKPAVNRNRSCAMILGMNLPFTSRHIFGKRIDPVTLTLPFDKKESTVFKTVGWVSAGLGAVALGLVVGNEIRQRYKFNRRTPYDNFSHSGDESNEMDFGMGI